MTLFKNAVQNTVRVSKTHNGADTYESTTNPLVDLYFAIGASRGKDITRMFEAALGADQEATLRMLFWARDITQGLGERQTFRDLMKHLEANHEMTALKLIRLAPAYGRWDDILIFSKPSLKREAYETIRKGLNDLSFRGLCAKWMPREKSKDKAVAKELREFLGMSPKDYRKMLAKFSKEAGVVEQKMCAKEWDAIDFNKVPSVASARYQKAFAKNAPEKYQSWKEALTSDDPVVRATAKVNAKTVYPHDIVKSVITGDTTVAQAQWDALPDLIGDSDSRILPVVDVSYSMKALAGVSNTRCLDVSVSLGLYLADKQKGSFKDVFCTFSTRPKLEVLRGDLVSKVHQLNAADWEMTTNIEAAFAEILKTAVREKVPENEMPTHLLILSDMEFNRATGGRGTAYDMAAQKYAQYGYELPKIVFWNLNAREGNNPVTTQQDGTALVSGFSPNLLKTILSGNLEKFSPEYIMRETISAPRYDAISKALK